MERKFDIRFPQPSENGRDQHEEFCDVMLDGELSRFRFHDYDRIYEVPGLYEQLFYQELECNSPAIVRELLGEVLPTLDMEPGDLRVLDVGAGNGIVGEELKALGAGKIVGVDIISEARAALERDRPGIYDDYVVVDLTDIPDDADAVLAAGDFNCLTTVAALGFDDMPPKAFAGGYQYLADGGLIAISIKADFVSGEDESGFSGMIHHGIDEGTIEVRGSRRYPHRLSAAGDVIEYLGIVAQKHGELYF